MTNTDVLLVAGIIFGFYMAWGIGANDVANSMADAVGSKALTVFWAVVLAAIFEFAGAYLVGGHVTDTIRKDIIETDAFANNPLVLATGLICALLAAAVWLNIASYFGAPVSTTHSTVGAVAGFGLLQAGAANIQWDTMGGIVASWFISPFAGGLIGFVVFKLITYTILAREKPMRAALMGVPFWGFVTFFVVSMAIIFKGLKHTSLGLSGPGALGVSVLIGVVAAVVLWVYLNRRWKGRDGDSTEKQLHQVERVFVILVIITSCSVAFSHGANDVANAIGPLAGAISIIQTGEISSQVGVSPWLLMLGGAGIVVGLATFGYRVMHTIGSTITEISPSRGVAADLGTMVTVLVCSRMGLPVSTTHTLVGAIIGVGLARGITAINLRTVYSIFASWILTLPIVAILTMLFFFPAKWLLGI